MSWCRWGSPCTNGVPPHPINENCGKDPCKGSDLYIYESDRGIECCGCRISKNGDFVAYTKFQMTKHIKKHHELGHHVRPSLLLSRREFLDSLPMEWHSFKCKCKRCKKIKRDERLGYR